MSNNEEFHCEFVPSVGDKDLFYKVTVSGGNEAKECEVSFENGICIASCEKLYPYLPYQIILSISDGVKERNVTIVTDLTVDENGAISYTSEWQ